MIVSRTKLNGVLKIRLDPFKDFRGKYLEIYNNVLFKKTRKKVKFIQDDISVSKKNVLRGIHFQWKKPQAQIMQLLMGKIFIAFIDFRPKSKTFLKKKELIIDSKNNVQIIMPPGVGSGFYALNKLNLMYYKVSEYYNPKFEMGIKWNCDKISINWPKGKKIISSKDKKNPTIKNINFKTLKDLNKLS